MHTTCLYAPCSQYVYMCTIRPRHMAMAEDQLNCPECKRGFNQKQNLNRHWQSVHGKSLAMLNSSVSSLASNFACPSSGCEFQSGRINTILEHLQEKHDQKSGMCVVWLSTLSYKLAHYTIRMDEITFQELGPLPGVEGAGGRKKQLLFCPEYGS